MLQTELAAEQGVISFMLGWCDEANVSKNIYEIRKEARRALEVYNKERQCNFSEREVMPVFERKFRQ